jgi:hypothetical protein
MARITRRRILKLSGAAAVATQTGGLAAIVTTGRAPAFAQETTGYFVASNPAPVVASQTASLDLLLVNTQTVVATMSATNSPIAWSITRGDPNGYFYIDNSGVIRCTVAGELGLTPGPVTLTISATNAAGTGQGTATITVANPHGRVLYVATTGSDSNNGLSAGAAWATVSHAFAALAQGDLLLVAPGTYTDYNAAGSGLVLNVAASATAPVVVRSQTRGGAVLDGQNDTTRAYVLSHGTGAAYQIMAGFKITNGAYGGITLTGTNTIKYRYNEIVANGTQGTVAQNQTALADDALCTGNVYNGNFIHDNGRISQGLNSDHGAQLSGTGTVLVNNIIWHNCAYGIILVAKTGYTPTAIVVNNIIGNHTVRSGLQLWGNGGSFSNVQIKNNIFVGNQGYAITQTTFAGTCTVDHNLAYNNRDGVDTAAAGYTSTSWLSSDPQFVNSMPAVPRDFRLQHGSPGIDSGVDASAVWGSDFNGVLRPQGAGWDMGVYER